MIYMVHIQLHEVQVGTNVNFTNELIQHGFSHFKVCKSFIGRIAEIFAGVRPNIYPALQQQQFFVNHCDELPWFI